MDLYPLKLLLRYDSTFFVLDFNRDIDVYTVKLSTVLSCNCPEKSCSPLLGNSFFCKHIKFVLFCVLEVSPQERPLNPSEVRCLLDRPMNESAFACDAIRLMFFERMFDVKTKNVEVEDGTLCPICLEEMRSKEEKKLVACDACEKAVHEQCFVKWKRSQENKELTCVICRAPWQDLGVYLSFNSQ